MISARQTEWCKVHSEEAEYRFGCPQQGYGEACNVVAVTILILEMTR